MMREERMEGMYAELIPAGAMKLHGLLREAGIEAYFVGGCVRDLIMGRKAKDWDMCCGAEPQALIGLLEDNDLKADSKWLQYDMVVTENEGETIEIRSFRRAADPLTGEKKRDLRTDLKARDFTMNAMAYDPLDGRVIDLFGGREDIAARRIKTVEPPDVRFARDPFAILRALRLSAELDFHIEENTYRAMEALSSEIGTVPSGRLAMEIGKMIRYARNRFL